MTEKMQGIIEKVKGVGEKIKTAATPTCKKLSEVYTEYDISMTKTSHLTPSQKDENGNEENVVTETCSTKLKLSLKDILLALTVLAVFATLLKMICKKK